MKLLSTLCIALLSLALHAQEFQGTVTYDILYEDLPPEAQAMASMMPNKTVLTFRDGM